MNENEFEIYGITYIAVDNKRMILCEGCAFENKECWKVEQIPFCDDMREDKRTVIFVEKRNE